MSVGESPYAGGVYARGSDGDIAAEPYCNRGPRGGGGRPERYCRTAHGDATDERQRHRDGVPFEDAGVGGDLPAGGYPGGSDWAYGDDHAGIREARRYGD